MKGSDCGSRNYKKKQWPVSPEMDWVPDFFETTEEAIDVVADGGQGVN